MVEAMRMNTELAKAVIEKFPAIMQSAAVLIHAADGAGIAARPPFLLGASEAESDEDDEEDDDDARATPAAVGGGLDLNALVAQIVPVVVAALMNGKLDLSKLGELLDWRKAAASGRATRATDAKPSNPTVTNPPKASARRAEPTAAKSAATSSDSLPPLDPAALAHFLAVRAALTPEESALAQEVARDLSPADLRKWFDELRALSVPDAVAKIRALIGTDDPKDVSAEETS
jgi:hypothetical protein